MKTKFVLHIVAHPSHGPPVLTIQQSWPPALVSRDPGNSHLLLRQELECAIETCTQLAGWKSASSIFLTPAFTDPRPYRCIRAQLNGATEHRLEAYACYINAVAASLQMHGDNGRHENKHCGIHPDERCETHPGGSRGTRCDRRRDIHSGSAHVFMERL
jgi:hypothetical protein